MAISAKFQADFSDFQAAVAKADLSLRTFETGAGKVGASLNKMANSLSGTSMIQQATIMAEAVERVGGTSRLTESELRRVSATATEAANKLRAMGQDVPPGIQKIADAAKNITPALSNADKAAGLLKSTFAQFTLAGLATNAISKLGSSLSEFAAQGAKLPALEQSFRRLAAGMGQDGTAMLNNMSTATRGLVSNYDLVTSANKAMLLGLPVTSASMGELAKTATVLGKAMGQDATTSLNDLITALGRSSPMILDNLGLTVKVGEANEAYAAKLKKSVDQLTDAEKKMAFYEAAMEAARKKTEQLGDQTRTFGEIVQSVWVSVGNHVSKGASILNQEIGGVIDNLIKHTFRYSALVNQVGFINANAMMQINKDQATMIRLAQEHAGKNYGIPEPAKVAAAATAVAAATEKQKTYAKAVAETIPLTAEQMQVNALLVKAKEHEKAAVEFAASAWKAWERAASQALKDVEKNSAPLLLITRDLSSFAPQVNAGGAGNMAGWVPPKAATPSIFASIFGSSAQFGQQMASTIMGAIQGGGNPISAAAGMVGSGIGSSIAGSLTKVGGALFGTALGGVLNSVLPGVGAMVGPLVDKLWGALFGTAGRDTKLDMAKQLFGSVEEMQRQMVDLLSKAEYDRLWKQFSEVGQNNKNQAVAAIDAITAAIDRQKKKTEEAAAAAAAAAQAQQDELDAISAKYSGVIDKLDSEFKSLSDSVAREAAEEFMGIVETQERARMEQIKSEKAAQEAMRDAEIAAKKSTFAEMLEAGQTVDEQLREMFAKGYRIPLRFETENAPREPLYTPPPPTERSAPGRSGGLTVQFVTPNMQVLAEGVVPELPAARARLGAR